MRICPDCQSRQLEWHQKFCSECAYYRDEHSRLISRHNFINSEKGKLWTKEYQRKYRQKNRLELNEWNRHYRRIDYVQEANRKRRETPAYKEKQKIANQTYYRNNKEKSKLATKTWRSKNTEKKQAQSKRYREKHYKDILLKNKLYRRKKRFEKMRLSLIQSMMDNYYQYSKSGSEKDKEVGSFIDAYTMAKTLSILVGVPHGELLNLYTSRVSQVEEKDNGNI